MNSLIKEHRDQHWELLNVLGDIRILLIPDRLTVRSNARAARRMLCHLGKLVQTHLSCEKHDLYPNLMTHQDAALRSMAWSFIERENPICRAFGSYRKKLIKIGSLHFSKDFITETLNLLDMLERHILLEEFTIFPKVEMAITHDKQFRSHENGREAISPMRGHGLWRRVSPRGEFRPPRRKRPNHAPSHAMEAGGVGQSRVAARAV